MTYKIEKGIQLTDAHMGRKAKYPVSQMEVGDSFLVSGDEHKLKSVRNSVHVHARRVNIEIATRTVEGGIRIWRVA